MSFSSMLKLIFEEQRKGDLQSNPLKMHAIRHDYSTYLLPLLRFSLRPHHFRL